MPRNPVSQNSVMEYYINSRRNSQHRFATDYNKLKSLQLQLQKQLDGFDPDCDMAPAWREKISNLMGEIDTWRQELWDAAFSQDLDVWLQSMPSSDDKS